jgi:hypothetical protein
MLCVGRNSARRPSGGSKKDGDRSIPNKLHSSNSNSSSGSSRCLQDTLLYPQHMQLDRCCTTQRSQPLQPHLHKQQPLGPLHPLWQRTQ